MPPDSFTVSLLHDIGKLTLSRFLDSDHLRWLAAAREQGGESSLRAEIEILGVHHGELGGPHRVSLEPPPARRTGHHLPSRPGDRL